MRLWSNSAERDQHENYASLFAIVKATEALEKAYTKDIITKTEYKEECSKLIAQFRRAVKLAGVTDMRIWMQQQQLNCPVAYHRLVESGVPDTGEVENSQKLIADIVHLFVTLQDAIKLDLVAVDTLQPHVEDICDKLSRFSGVPPDSDIKGKVQKWLRTLNAMKASDQLDSEQSRQMAFDISSAHEAFYKMI
jgi:ESCRT-I complex subunit VPS28